MRRKVCEDRGLNFGWQVIEAIAQRQCPNGDMSVCYSQRSLDTVKYLGFVSSQASSNPMSAIVLLLVFFSFDEKEANPDRRCPDSAIDGLLELLVDSFVALLPPSLDDEV